MRNIFGKHADLKLWIKITIILSSSYGVLFPPVSPSGGGNFIRVLKCSVYKKKIGILRDEWEPHFIEYFTQIHSGNLRLNICLSSVLLLLLLHSSADVVPPSRSVFLKHPTDIVPIAPSSQATSFRINTQLSVFPFRFSWGYSFLLQFPLIRKGYFVPCSCCLVKL